MKWKVISDHDPESVLQDKVWKFGLINFNIKEYEQDEILCHLFLKLTFLKWKEKVSFGKKWLTKDAFFRLLILE